MLGLDLVARGDGFRFRDPKTGDFLPDHQETAAALCAAQARIAELEAMRQGES